ncbi:MAG: serine threonine kinase [Lasallia pustulata]|uniref:Serine threonine kinase n=1 Tax=Lasallia pustulata TaxID=136370 RepID=A0A5M8PW81_9LECA|nr:MAG: serine threonine kinase [Lasallia pustulata]
MTDTDISNTIVYLRPRSDEAIRALDDQRNSHLVRTITPHDPMAGLSDSFALHPRVFRLGFDSKQKQASEGFLVGTGSDSDIFLPNHGDIPAPHPGNFRIHYNFQSGALLVTALGRLRIGATFLQRQQSLVLMAGTDIECDIPALLYMFEFPYLGQYAADHEANYRAYVGWLGIPNALYMAASRSEEPLLDGLGLYTPSSKSQIKITRNLESIERRRELLLDQLHHPNILHYHHAFVDGTVLNIVMELAVNDLKAHLQSRGNPGQQISVPLRCVQSIAQQALSAIEYLHNRDITHRDLKHENILVTKWNPATDLPTIKLADFGLVSFEPESHSLVGTPGWLAPELSKAYAQAKRSNKAPKDFKYTNAVDIWAMGKILKELLGYVPETITDRGKTVPVPKDAALSLSKRMMSIKPQQRPTASLCLQDSWISAAPNPNGLAASKRRRSSFSSASSAQLNKRVKAKLTSRQE